MVISDLLQKVEAFKALKKEDLEEISSFSSEKLFNKKYRLFKEGEDAAYLWVVKEGLVDLRFDLPARETSGESTLLSMDQFKIVGWSSFVPPHKYKLSAYCASDNCRVIMIKRDAFLEYLGNKPKAGYQVFSAMLRVVGQRFQRLQSTLEDAHPVRA